MTKKKLFVVKYSIIIMLASLNVQAHLNDQLDDDAWDLLESKSPATIDASLNTTSKFTVKFSNEKNRYELSYNDKYLGHGDIGIGCHAQDTGLYDCVAFNATECLKAVYDKGGKEIKTWEKDSSCGLNNTPLATKIFDTLDTDLKIGAVSDYYTVKAEHEWICAPGQELWALKNSSDHKFLLSTNLLPHYIPFLYDEESRKDSSYCVENVGENQYKIQARESDAYINDGYLNQAGSEFNSKKETAGIFSITMATPENTVSDTGSNTALQPIINAENSMSEYKILPTLTASGPVDNLVTIPQTELSENLEVATIPESTAATNNNLPSQEISPTSLELKQYLENVFQIILILIISLFFLFIGTRGGPGPRPSNGNGPKTNGGGANIGDIGGGGSSGNW